MPNIKSAKKRVKVIKVKTLRNQILKSALKTAVKRLEIAIAGKDTANVQAAYQLAVKKLDQSVSKGILHKNKAANKKSQLTLALNSMDA